MHCLNNIVLKNVIREYRAIKYAFTIYDTTGICHCWNNGR